MNLELPFIAGSIEYYGGPFINDRLNSCSSSK